MLVQRVSSLRSSFRCRQCTVPRRNVHVRQSSRYLSSAEVRQSFLDFFAANNHVIVPSTPVLPKDDATLFFVNAGMNQFKDVLLGKKEPVHRRVANSQKCIRAGGKHNDLDEVGQDGRHQTFFEMLGNWSFGDYFQQEACSLAYKLLTEVYKLPKDLLFITYFEGDGEVGLGPDFSCREIWRSIGVADSHIIPLGMDDNFWAMGDEGPCGPCTEIHYSPTGNPKDMLELWNLVFMQFNRTKRGSLEPLSTKNVDTGMGLERLVSVLQGKNSNYDTDLFSPLLKTIQQLTKSPPYQSKFGADDHNGINTAYRIVADHARMFTAAIADGIIPGRQESPFYVRKILRRAAMTFSTKLGGKLADLSQLVPVVVDSLGGAYPEIDAQCEFISQAVDEDLRKFEEVMKKGTKAFADLVKKLDNKMVLPGDRMFSLFHSTGIPEDVILDLAKSRNMTCDMDGFYARMEEERQRSKNAWIKGQNKATAPTTL